MTFPIILSQGNTSRASADVMAHELRRQLGLPLYCTTVIDPKLGPVYRIEEHALIGTA